MTKITQIDDRSAASAWCPIREYADVIALGAKVSHEWPRQWHFEKILGNNVFLITFILVLAVLHLSILSLDYF